jgi:NAD dependent epimerase/dehydratase
MTRHGSKLDWKNRPVLVTGAGGFIGSHVVKALVDQGARVRAFVRYNSRGDVGLLSLLPAAKREVLEIVAGDLRDSHAVAQACRGVSHIFHLGALIAIPYSYLHPREVVETNVLGTLNVLMAARGTEVERVVHTSTSEVYGTAETVPISEIHPLQGQSPYSASKIGADKLAESFYCSYDLPVATIRPFNTYGPGQSARAVIPTIITQALVRDVVCLGALTPRRDFTYVEDIVDAFLKIAEADGAVGQTINVGSRQEITVGDLTRKIIGLIGRDIDIVTEEQRLRPERSEVRRLLADNRRAQELLGWSPRVSLEEGLSKTIDWISRHLDRYNPEEYRI